MRPLALALALALLLPSAGAAVRTSWRGEDATTLAERLLRDPAWREAADARGPLVFEVAIAGREPTRFVYESSIGPTESRPDAILAMSEDAALVVLNAEDPARAIRCLLDDGALAVTPRETPARVALRAYRMGLEATCDASPREGWILDAYGSPLGWRDVEAETRLGRAEAGVSRLAPDEIERPVSAPDLADPWFAPLALEAILQRALDCPCEGSAALIPAGDPRAQLAADPRASEGSP